MKLKEGDKYMVVKKGYYYKLNIGEKLTYIQYNCRDCHEWRLKDGSTISMSVLSNLEKVKPIKLSKTIIK